MSALKGACAFGQSGGPTAVINASACGVIETALKSENISAVYACQNGVKGVLNDRFYDMGIEDAKEIALLRTTPGAAFGSCRYKLKDIDVDETDYARIVEVFKSRNIRYFFYNGGNDSMDTCERISRYCKKVGYECNVIGVPKTIDNDLALTDHCPGYASAAKYVATSIAEVSRDLKVYNPSSVVVVEIMGRNAGWLAAGAALADVAGEGPDLVYLPEVAFDMDKFLADVKRIYDEKGVCIVAASEGIRDASGNFITELLAQNAAATDAFGHTQMGGLAHPLAALINEKLGVKTRGIELSLLQRCAAHCASKVDVDEAYAAGKAAVEAALAGQTAQMITFNRVDEGGYKCECVLHPLDKIANEEKLVPREWINDEGNRMNKEFYDYALPLIQGDSHTPTENGMPRYAKLKLELVK